MTTFMAASASSDPDPLSRELRHLAHSHLQELANILQIQVWVTREAVTVLPLTRLLTS